jgi:hypothetical protein
MCIGVDSGCGCPSSPHLGSKAVEGAIAGAARVGMAKSCVLLLLLWLQVVMLRVPSDVALQLQAGVLLLLVPLRLSLLLQLLLLQQTLVCERLLQLLCCEPALHCS